jgi:hypothetical protein
VASDPKKTFLNCFLVALLGIATMGLSPLYSFGKWPLLSPSLVSFSCPWTGKEGLGEILQASHENYREVEGRFDQEREEKILYYDCLPPCLPELDAWDK